MLRFYTATELRSLDFTPLDDAPHSISKKHKKQETKSNRRRGEFNLRFPINAKNNRVNLVKSGI